MSTSAWTRNKTSFYLVTKKKINKNVEDDTLKNKFSNLAKARYFARNLRKIDNFKSLVNSNGIYLPM